MVKQRAGEPQGAELVRFVGAVRRRRAVHALLQVATWWIAWAIGGYVLRHLGATVAIAWQVAGLVGVLFVVAMRWQRMDVLRTAIWLERGRGWRERLSTAVETRSSDGVLVRALQADALSMTRGLTPAAVAPFAWSRGAVVVVVTVIAITAAIELALPSLIAGLAPPEEQALADADSELRQADIDRLADVVQRVADVRDDAYLRAVADALRKAAEAMGDSGSADAAVEAQMANALEHLQTAFGSTMEGRPLADRLLSDEYAEQLAREEAGGGVGDYLALGAEPLNPLNMSVEPAGQAAASADVGEDGPLDPMGQEVESEAAPGGGEPGVRGSLDESAGGGGEPLFEPGAQDAAMGAPFGGAAQSGAGDSALAGRGSQGLEGAATDLSASPLDGELVVVGGRERDEGRRIEVHVPPAVGVAESSSRAVPTVGAWVEAVEAPVDRGVVAERYRSMVGRFLEPSHALRRRSDP